MKEKSKKKIKLIKICILKSYKIMKKKLFLKITLNKNLKKIRLIRK